MAGDNDFACVTETEDVMRLYLSPVFTNNFRAGILNELENSKFKYSPLFDGILVDFKCVRVMSASGDVGWDGCRPVCKIKGKFSVFSPHIGSILKARVNKVSREHVGCILHGKINISLHLTPEINRQISSLLVLDSDILFEVTAIDNNIWDIVRIKGKITPKCINLMRENFSLPVARKIFDENGNSMPDDATETTNYSSSEETVKACENNLSERARNSVKIRQVQDNIMSFLEDSLSSLKDTSKNDSNPAQQDGDVHRLLEVIKIEPGASDAGPSTSAVSRTTEQEHKSKTKKDKSSCKKSKKETKKQTSSRQKETKQSKTNKSKGSSKSKNDKSKKLKDKIKTKMEKAKKDRVKKKKEKKKSEKVSYPVPIEEIKLEV